MPVYNEAEIIAEVIEQWTAALKKLGTDFQIHAYNDGSKDNTFAVLRQIAVKNPRLIVHNKPNSGHGPTLILGYRDNAQAQWIFQVDSDNEMGPENFSELWEKRGNYDFLIGRRVQRGQVPLRKLISSVSRGVVKLFFGSRVTDVNCPYRLMRTERFRELFFALPDDMFAPNVTISGYASRKSLAVYETDIPLRPRMTGEVSLKKFKLLKAAARSFWQTVHFAFSGNK